MKSTSTGIVEVAHQVREEEHRALEHADQQQVLARVVARDLLAPARAPAAPRSSAGTRISPIACVVAHASILVGARRVGVASDRPRSRAACAEREHPVRRSRGRPRAGPAPCAVRRQRRDLVGASRRPRRPGRRRPRRRAAGRPAAAAPAAARAARSSGISLRARRAPRRRARRAPRPRRAGSRPAPARSPGRPGWIALSAGTSAAADAAARVRVGVVGLVLAPAQAARRGSARRSARA